MRNWKSWLLLTGVFYLFFLAWRLPADLCWRWWASRPEAAAVRLQVEGIEGAWSGGRVAVLQSGAVRLTGLTWDFRPLGLLAGRLKFALSANLQGSAPVAATLAVGPRSQELRNFRGLIPAGPLGEALLPGLGLAGSLESRNLELTVEQGRLVAAGGDLSWLEAGMSFPEPVTLGDLDLHLANESGMILATLKDRGGPLQVNVLATIRPDGNYELTGELLPRERLTPELTSLMRFFGPATADGRVRLQRTGRLAPIY